MDTTHPRSRSVLGPALAALVVCLACLSCRPNPKATPAPPPPPSGPAWFEDRAAASGVKFRLSHDGRTPLDLFETIGTGAAVCDFDADGHADLFLVGQKMKGTSGRSALYRNKGNGTFADASSGSGLEEPGLYTGCAVGDIDNDNRPDLLVVGFGVVRLYRNLGRCRFADVTKGSGLECKRKYDWYSSAGFSDVDRDGRLDLYIGRYVEFNETSLRFCDYGNVKSACGPIMYDPQLGSMYLSSGGFRFREVTAPWGLEGAHGKCLGVAFGDPDSDGWPDLYIANDEMPGDLFINKGGKGFTETALERGVALSGDGSMQGGMGVDFGDYNRDGLLDLIVTTFQYEATSLYTGTPSGVFEHSTVQVGLDKPTRPYVKFGVKLVDLDNDGWLDIAATSGHIHDNMRLIDKNSDYRTPSQLFMSERGVRFVERSKEAGPGFTTPVVGRGLAVGDLDNDGRQDIVIADLEGATRVLMNRMPATGSWLRVTLEGTKSNRMALGARLSVVAGKERWIAQCTTAASFQSACDPRVHFGLGAVKSVDRVEVLWPSGRKSVVANPKIPGDLKIKEP